MSNNSEIKNIIIPQIGPNDAEATLVEWFVKDGDKVKKGDSIFSLETAKSIIEIESEYEGIIVTLFDAGEILNTGSIIGFIGNDLNILNAEKQTQLSSNFNNAEKKINATNKAVQLANKLNIDINDIKQDRIIKSSDVRSFFESKSVGLSTNHNREQIELNDYQKAVIKTISWQQENAIVGYIEKIIDIKPVREYSAIKKKNNGWLLDPLFAIIAFNFVQHIKINKKLNTSINDGKVNRYSEINLGFTIDVEDKLIISVLPNADKYDEDDFIEKLFSLQKRTVTGDLKPNEMQKPTIGITSLAAYGVSRHIPILIPETSIIIALSDIMFSDRKINEHSVFGVTYDHRLHSGVQISKMLKAMNNQLITINNN